jgi:hypothetical protein
MATAIAIRTVTINAAFLQEIKEVHEELWQLLKDVERQLSEPLHERPRRLLLIGLLERLRDQLALHFALEEAYGYFEDPIHVAPQVCELAMALRAEHRRLYVVLCDLVEDAQRWDEEGQWSLFRSQLVAEYLAFHNRFQLHESKEVALIQQQTASDSGSAD